MLSLGNLTAESRQSEGHRLLQLQEFGSDIPESQPCPCPSSRTETAACRSMTIRLCHERFTRTGR